MTFGLRLCFSLVRNLRKNIIISNNIARNMSSKEGVMLNTIINKLEEFAPLILSEKWDNTGILIEPYTPRIITKILLTNDLTEDVLEEAVSTKSEMIISYHPPIFAALKTVTQRNWKERIVSRCLEERITVFSPHTSWDSVNDGVNDWLASCLPEHDRQVVVEGPLPGTGQGRLCKFKSNQTVSSIIKYVKDHVNLDHLQLALARNCTENTQINTVALCAGSGSSVLKGVNADLFITGEMSHHDVLDAIHCNTSVILMNHSNSERGFLTKFATKLQNMLQDKIEVFVSVKDADPLKVV